MRSRIALALALALACVAGQALGHDIPDARVDRSIQATLGLRTLRIDYEVSLAELTLIQDLRRLELEVSGSDREAWYHRYGEATGPLNARGFLVSVDGAEVDLKVAGFGLMVEGHPRFTFHFEGDVPPAGRLSIRDTNYQAAEGTSRLALRLVDGVVIQGDVPPTDVEQVPIRPTWQLTDDEERRTRNALVDYSQGRTRPTALAPLFVPTARSPGGEAGAGLTRLLDEEGGRGRLILLAISLVLGAVHAIQPGHGKTIVAAASLDSAGGPARGAFLGLATAVVHMTSVALIAGALWATRGARPAEIHVTLTRMAGFAIAAAGSWKVGRHLGGHAGHDHEPGHDRAGAIGLLPLAMAGGLVPCWDAVALILVAEALGRLPLGLALLAAFSLGMAGTLVAVGLLAGRLRAAFDRRRDEGKIDWRRGFGVLGGLILASMGIAMLVR